MSIALFALAALAAVPAKAKASLASLRWERRVLLVSAPHAANPAAEAQRGSFADLGRGADDRDLVLVEVLGGTVRGASDSAAALRRDYTLPADRFTVILIGKDGGEKRRSGEPMSAATLTATIDAMPMRRNGER